MIKPERIKAQIKIVQKFMELIIEDLKIIKMEKKHSKVRDKMDRLARIFNAAAVSEDHFFSHGQIFTRKNL